jgi:hypothetical protein
MAGCGKAVAAPDRLRHTTTLKIKGKNKKSAPTRVQTPAHQRSSKNTSTTTPLPLMWQVILFKFTYNITILSHASMLLPKSFKFVSYTCEPTNMSPQQFLVFLSNLDIILFAMR